MPATETIHCIHACNSLLRGEISAIETYTQAIDRFRELAESALLEDIRREHVTSANQLRELVRALGGLPSNDSGPWGAWAMTVEGIARFLGPKPALKALLEGERLGQEEYEDALDNDDMVPEATEIIREDCLPRLRNHSRILRSLIAAQ
jgi:hypothetical protein